MVQTSDAPAVRAVFAAAVIALTSAVQPDESDASEELAGPPPPQPSRANTPQPQQPTKVSEDAGRRMNRLTMGPVSILGYAVAFEYEGALTDKVCVYMGPRIGWPTAVELYGGMRIFPLPNDLAPEGFWLGFGWLFSYVSIDPAVRLDAMLGYTFISNGGFTASFGAGVRPVVPNTTLLGLLSGHLNLGYAF
jgi:hypothetical protein